MGWAGLPPGDQSKVRAFHSDSPEPSPPPPSPEGKEWGHAALPLAVWPWAGHVPSLNLFFHLQQGDDGLCPEYLRGCNEGQLREGHGCAQLVG